MKTIVKIIKDKRGLSFVEMIVAVVIMGILMGVLSYLIIRSFAINRHTLEQGLNNAIMQNSLRRLVANMREAKQADSGAYMIELADDYELIFYANIDDDDATERVHYYLQDNRLMLGVSEGSGFPVTYPESDQEIRTVVGGIINDGTQPLFFYYDQDYPEISTANFLTTPANVGDIYLVQVSIFVNINPDQAPDSAHVETFVRPRNIDH